jgi:hypothetical protein
VGKSSFPACADTFAFTLAKDDPCHLKTCHAPYSKRFGPKHGLCSIPVRLTLLEACAPACPGWYLILRHWRGEVFDQVAIIEATDSGNAAGRVVSPPPLRRRGFVAQHGPRSRRQGQRTVAVAAARYAYYFGKLAGSRMQR